MKIQCPHCQTDYELEPDLLVAAEFHVACSHCRRLFHARQPRSFLEAAQEQARSDEEIETLLSEMEAALAEAAPQEHRKQSREPLPAAAMDHRVPPEMADLRSEELPREFLLHTPELERQRRSPRRWIAPVLLSLLLAGQLAWLQRDTLLAQPRLRALATRICPYLGCTLPRPAPPPVYSLLDSRFEPLAPRRYRLQLLLRNESPRPAPPPTLRITLSDSHGRVLARRTLEPALWQPRHRSQPLAPGESLELALTLATPAGEAAGYDVTVDPPAS